MPRRFDEPQDIFLFKHKKLGCVYMRSAASDTKFTDTLTGETKLFESLRAYLFKGPRSGKRIKQINKYICTHPVRPRHYESNAAWREQWDVVVIERGVLHSELRKVFIEQIERLSKQGRFILNAQFSYFRIDF